MPHDFVDPAIEEVRKVRYARDEASTRSWSGGASTRSRRDRRLRQRPRRRRAADLHPGEDRPPRPDREPPPHGRQAPEDEPELTLFDSFDGLDELDQVDFYKHDANWSNRMILGDSLQVMASLAEREKLRGKVQMVYIDPPYGIKFGSNWQASTRKPRRQGRQARRRRPRSRADQGLPRHVGARHPLLPLYLRDRLLVARELLTESGSCFVQIGDENVHLVRSLMDEVFGTDNFVSHDRVRKKTTGADGQSCLESAPYDYIIWYAKERAQVEVSDQLFRDASDRGSMRRL